MTMEPTQPLMNEEGFVYSHEYAVSSRFITVTCTILSFIILFYHFLISCRANKQRKKKFVVEGKYNKLKRKILRYILYYCVISAFLWNTVSVLFYFDGPHINQLSVSTHSCFILAQISALLWFSNKICLFYGYFLRLDYIYKGTEYQINKWILYIFYILFIGYFIVWLYLIFGYVSPSNYEFNEKYGFCQVVASIQSSFMISLSVGIISFELITSIIALILYLRPLCHLKRMENDRDLHDTIIKIGILNSIIIISCILSIAIWSVTTAGVFLFIDNVINSLCLILMTNYHQKTYQRVCFICICYGCCQYEESMKNTIENMSSNTPPISAGVEV